MECVNEGEAVTAARAAGARFEKIGEGMSTLLRLSALSCLLWALVLLGLKDLLIAPEQLTPVARGLANGLGITQLVLIYFFWRAAAAPAENRVTIQAAIFLMAAKTANDLYEIIILLPPQEALGSVIDLMISVALLVGLLEALPRTFGTSGPVE